MREIKSTPELHIPNCEHKTLSSEGEVSAFLLEGWSYEGGVSGFLLESWSSEGGVSAFLLEVSCSEVQ